MEQHSLTKRELQIMQVLWDSSESMSAREITDKSVDLSQNTVQSVLRRLLKLGFIKTDGVGYSGTVLTRKYLPSYSHANYLTTTMSSSAINRLVANFIEESTEEDQLQKLEELIKDKRESLKNRGDL